MRSVVVCGCGSTRLSVRHAVRERTRTPQNVEVEIMEASEGQMSAQYPADGAGSAILYTRAVRKGK